MPIHHEFRKGKRVLVILRDGQKLVGKFNKNIDNRVLKLDICDIPYKKIRAVTIYKPNKELHDN